VVLGGERNSHADGKNVRGVNFHKKNKKKKQKKETTRRRKKREVVEMGNRGIKA